jgi:3-deoxy-D-manno-octulosonic-acid transferase
MIEAVETVYRGAMWVYGGLIRLVAAMGNAKAQLWVAGRRAWRERVSSFEPGGPTLWMHCASLGEFEQGRPVLERLKQMVPGLKVVLTFFSPSGYEVRKDYAQADLVCYLPDDSPANARDFVSTIRPTLAVFVKYELWYYFLRELRNQSVPAVVIAANLRPGESFDAPGIRFWYWRVFGFITHVFTQDTGGVQVALLVGAQAASAAGDPRFDRVVAIAEQAERVPYITEWIAGRPCLVAGSVWPKDIELISKALSLLKVKTGHDVAVIWAPHVTSPDLVRRFVAQHGGQTYADLAEPTSIGAGTACWIDRVGLLARLYQHADLCYVGGGFGAGVHNTLEAAVWGKRVLFGPKHTRFNEAVGLISAGAAASVRSAQDLSVELEALVRREPALLESGARAAQYVREHAGATAKITEALVQYLTGGPAKAR